MSKLSSYGDAVGRRLMLVAAAAGAIMVTEPVAFARLERPFTNFAGSWRGSGRVLTTDGKSERLACRATYSVSADATSLSQSLVCASDTYRVDIRSDIVADGHNIQGSWQESTRNVNGGIAGTMEHGSIQGTVTCPGFNAQIFVRTMGRKQIVSIRPEGMDVTAVDITMTR